ncbi:MAG: GNAT family N-acetyltransferase [Candidatus Aerophobus sp.]|nr:MAG: GNAT family N-acetyltransferase [Candidatus Aerophobus sp.]
MEIICITKDDQKEVDDFVMRSPDAWLFHLYDWGEICQQAFGQQPLSFILRDGKGALIGLMPLALRKEMGFRILLSAGFGGGGGVALSPDLGKKQRRKASQRCHEEIDVLARKHGADYIQITLPATAESNFPGLRPQVNPLLHWGFQDTSHCVYLMDLFKDIDEIWMNLSVSCRNEVRQAQNRGVQIERAQGKDDIDEFFDMLVETLKRTKAGQFPYRYFRLIWDHWGGEKDWVNLFFATYTGNRVAGAIIGKFKKGGVYWSAASRAEYHTLRPNKLLQGDCIQWLKAEGCHWYEIGEAYLFPKSPKERGLDLFKRSFGGDVHYLYQGIMVYHPWKYRLLGSLLNFRDKVKGMFV